MRVTLTREQLAQVIADRFDPQGYSGAVVTIPTDGGLAIEWTCDWTATDDDHARPDGAGGGDE